MSDSLKQAVEAMEAAWRRLREVLDGPDVAAALVERQAVRPMSTAPRDGTWFAMHLPEPAGRVCAMFDKTYGCFVGRDLKPLPISPIGWSPVRPEAYQWPSPMSTAPRDGTYVMVHFKDGRSLRCQRLAGSFFNSTLWTCDGGLYHEGDAIGWSPVK